MKAFARAHALAPTLRLVIAGDGPCRADLESMARTLGVADRVHFLGWVEDLPRLYATLDMFALSSLSEGTPVAAIEAMAAGRPVISTDVGGVADVVADGIDGVLVPAADVESMAAAIAPAGGGPFASRQDGRGSASPGRRPLLALPPRGRYGADVRVGAAREAPSSAGSCIRPRPARLRERNERPYNRTMLAPV